MTFLSLHQTCTDEDAYSHQFLIPLVEVREVRSALGVKGCMRGNDESGFMVAIRILFEWFLSFLLTVHNQDADSTFLLLSYLTNPGRAGEQSTWK